MDKQESTKEQIIENMKAVGEYLRQAVMDNEILLSHYEQTGDLLYAERDLTMGAVVHIIAAKIHSFIIAMKAYGEKADDISVVETMSVAMFNDNGEMMSWFMNRACRNIGKAPFDFRRHGKTRK
jgi:hypothetical protein